MNAPAFPNPGSAALRDGVPCRIFQYLSDGRALVFQGPRGTPVRCAPEELSPPPELEPIDGWIADRADRDCRAGLATIDQLYDDWQAWTIANDRRDYRIQTKLAFGSALRERGVYTVRHRRNWRGQWVRQLNIGLRPWAVAA